MAAEARRRGAAHVRQLTILGDGAVRIWNLASEHSRIKAEERDKALGCFKNQCPPGCAIGTSAPTACSPAPVPWRGRLQSGHRAAPETVRHALVSAGRETGILTLRCQHASGRWEEIWQQPGQPDAIP